jgi:hypothetical protein
LCRPYRAQERKQRPSCLASHSWGGAARRWLRPRLFALPQALLCHRFAVWVAKARSARRCPLCSLSPRCGSSGRGSGCRAVPQAIRVRLLQRPRHGGAGREPQRRDPLAAGYILSPLRGSSGRRRRCQAMPSAHCATASRFGLHVRRQTGRSGGVCVRGTCAELAPWFPDASMALVCGSAGPHPQEHGTQKCGLVPARPLTAILTAAI